LRDASHYHGQAWMWRRIAMTIDEMVAIAKYADGKLHANRLPNGDFSHDLAAQLSDPFTALQMAPQLVPGRGLVAPLETQDLPHSWEGRAKLKPWAYATTVAIPHLNTPEILTTCLQLLQLQTIRPYVLIIDTGSGEAVRSQLERMRSDSVEVHYVRGHGYIHSSGAVALAMDLAFAHCLTDLLVSTHTDVFLKRRDSLAWLIGQCSEQVPVVGPEMSPRDDPRWQGCVSHTFTAWHMPTMRRIRANWNFKGWYEAEGVPPRPTTGFPDTEQPINRCLQQAGVKPTLIGRDTNAELQRTEYFDHARTLTGARTYYAKGAAQLAMIEAYTAVALADAKQRIATWTEGGPSLLQKAANFAGAVVNHVATGMQPATPEVQASRLAICASNECGYHDRGKCLHKDCGCNLQAKAGWAEQACPIGKW
jgi:hypothetical protein